MFTLTKILNSKSSVPELVEIKIAGSTSPILANHIYYYNSEGLSAPTNVKTSAALFIPARSYDEVPEKVLGYFITTDMIFSANYTDMMGCEPGWNFYLRQNEVENGPCFEVEPTQDETNTLGRVISNFGNKAGEILIRFCN